MFAMWNNGLKAKRLQKSHLSENSFDSYVLARDRFPSVNCKELGS